MSQNGKKKSTREILLTVGSIALSVTSAALISKVAKKYSNLAYKKALIKEKIDFDDMGPVIEKKPQDTAEKTGTEEE